jgi:uncharacterized membrane protein SpoIIM required for sporulation
MTTHRALYGARAERPAIFRQWAVQGFPRLVRSEWKVVCISLAAFYATALILGILVWRHPDQASVWLDGSQIESARRMYSPHNFRLGRGGSQGDIAMFGFYIWNNISICFRTFASGILGGVPALASLALNGANLGVIGSVLSADPSTRTTFWSFVITHSSFEITGLILSGAAGLKLGYALLAPGRLSRKRSLAETGRQILPLLAGAALLTLLAAFFEGFWSAQTIVPAWGKFVSGAVCWSLVISYLLFAGRSRGH